MTKQTGMTRSKLSQRTLWLASGARPLSRFRQSTLRNAFSTLKMHQRIWQEKIVLTLYTKAKLAKTKYLGVTGTNQKAEPLTALWPNFEERFGNGRPFRDTVTYNIL